MEDWEYRLEEVIKRLKEGPFPSTFNGSSDDVGTAFYYLKINLNSTIGTLKSY